MRIIAGMARGISLTTPKSDKTRPTSDRVKEAVFSALENRIGFDDVQVIDLFAGTGALGLEAVSRGATHCTFVEKNEEMCKVIKGNKEKISKSILQYVTKAPIFEVINGEVEKTINKIVNIKLFDIVFCDPPYEKEFVDLTKLVKPGGVIVYETSKAKFDSLKDFLKLFDIIYSKTIGDTAVVIAALPSGN